MSVQFGQWNFDGQPVQPEYIEKVNALLAPYGPDGGSSYSASGLAILYHAFHTTKESRTEKQPYISNSGAVITWDGRLDNRADLIRELSEAATASSTDVEIAAVAYEEWAEKSFAKLIGDWAISIWNPATRSLILAKDVIGTRHLYYAVEEQRITWSTILDPLVLLAGHKFQLCEEYIAGWLGFFPAAHLTPYVGIDSVPASSFVCLRPAKCGIRKYWDFDPTKRIRYQTDGEYEEHFRTVFAESVRRRLRSDTPVLAELSGGMDSSSIVCMADEIIGRGLAETPRLDTISYYDDSEPNWNEKPYFSVVEDKRGQSGFHVDLTTVESFPCDASGKHFLPTPAHSNNDDGVAMIFLVYLQSHANRALLSGVGGDEFTGGVPTPIPELADLLATARLTTLARKLKAWALAKRKPCLHLLLNTGMAFLPPRPGRGYRAPWIVEDFAVRYRRCLDGYDARLTVRSALPSFQSNGSTLNGMRRQLESTGSLTNPPLEKRYPYLDRDLLVFLYAVPRDQLLRPGERRSLMRRALVGIVPSPILGRRRKAFVSRAPMKSIVSLHSQLGEPRSWMVSAALGIVDPNVLAETIRKVWSGQQTPVVPLIRAIALEMWLRNLRNFGQVLFQRMPDRNVQRIVGTGRKEYKQPRGVVAEIQPRG